MLEHFSYHTGQYDKVEDFVSLAKKLEKLEAGAKKEAK
jgi:hypothetical protein